jgi:GNAT superfamily N-acetyltransferase
MEETRDLSLTRDPAPQDLQFLDDRIYEHNSARTGRDDGQLFAIYLRGPGGEIQAGLSGWTWADACEIRILWVHESMRGQDYGTRLMAMAEQEAISRGCKAIMLSSYSFQAPGFYQKLGYETVACLEDFPPGHQNYILVKRL